MALEDYKKALRLGQKEYRSCVSRGVYPYPQVLDDILVNAQTRGEVSLGLVDLPTERIFGTKTAGRKTAFARNFMPLLEEDSEFASKWSALCDAHLEEGIRDPIKAYEFMNRFYVLEGHKRVSVLKYFDAVSIPAVVTRILPTPNDSVESKIYYEFLEFYHYTGINYLWFSREGCFQSLLAALELDASHVWDETEKRQFRSAYISFSKAYEARNGNLLPITTGDALLTYLDIYGYPALLQSTPNELKANIAKVWDEFLVLENQKPVDLSMQPAETPQKNLLHKLFLSAGQSHLKISFVHAKSTDDSGWTYNHEMGRLHLEHAFPGQVETCCFDRANDLGADERIAEAIDAGSQVIFTTTPRLIGATLKAAVEHPEIRFLNCSLTFAHPSIRTYYGRMYEAKFLTGAIAGALTENGKIGYIADYPIYGMGANINAFALGAKMVNPRAKVYLEWSTVEGRDVQRAFQEKGISIISNQDMVRSPNPSRQFGLCHVDGDKLTSLALPVWQWGIFYERIVRSILDGSWKSEASPNSTRAINYWWGMSAGVIDVFYSRTLPIGTLRLIELLRRTITTSDFNPFAGILYSQSGMIQKDPNNCLAPDEIIRIDWLADNVVGSFPDLASLTQSARDLVQIQGVIGKNLPSSQKDGKELGGQR